MAAAYVCFRFYSTKFLVATVLIVPFSIVFIWRLIKRAEAGDPVNDQAPNPGTVSKILDRENHHPLNLLITVSPIKPNWFRPITLRAVFAAIQSLGNCSGRPGFLGPMGNIGDVARRALDRAAGNQGTDVHCSL